MRGHAHTGTIWSNRMLKVGDKVSKIGGDYKFDGIIVAIFQKLSGLTRLVVEDDRGVLHIYSEKNLKLQEYYHAN